MKTLSDPGRTRSPSAKRKVIPEKADEEGGDGDGNQTTQVPPPKKKIRFPKRKEEGLAINARTTGRTKLRIVCSASHWLMDKGPQRSFKLHGNNSTMKSSLPPMKFKLI